MYLKHARLPVTPHLHFFCKSRDLVWMARLELAASAVRVRRSTRLSYIQILFVVRRNLAITLAMKSFTVILNVSGKLLGQKSDQILTFHVKGKTPSAALASAHQDLVDEGTVASGELDRLIKAGSIQTLHIFAGHLKNLIHELNGDHPAHEDQDINGTAASRSV